MTLGPGVSTPRLLSLIEAHFHERGVFRADMEAPNDFHVDQPNAPVAEKKDESPAVEPLLVPASPCGTVSPKDPQLLKVAQKLQASSRSILRTLCN